MSQISAELLVACVLQVWFQNRRSKERRMKQLSVVGTRRQFYHHGRPAAAAAAGVSATRRLRQLMPGVDELTDETVPPPGGAVNFTAHQRHFAFCLPGHCHTAEIPRQQFPRSISRRCR